MEKEAKPGVGCSTVSWEKHQIQAQAQQLPLCVNDVFHNNSSCGL